ncbi:tryptophan synthase subunit alpha [Endomicrobium proavitum]|uniref:Tryptophan synthase alpha chain n=1 Tax=Endomicrobium proavitum TaxID=1408281 RepID=A0A0G3WHH7_9BACT|nr:tryptophan synthase subunit alpha [Endomicrobium proavitum]AKL98081.1 Tryptophan synthase alpha chain [Endomicrobium proavitum]
MSKITEAFKNKKLFIAYLMAGDPALEKTAEYILTLQNAGAGLIEIGIPFSDPIAEGEVIQGANIRALSNSIKLNDIFDMLVQIKDKITVPLVFMTYINPLFVYGYDKFFAMCEICGISGVIVPDLPFEEQDEIKSIMKKYGIDIITLVSPTSSKERTKNIAENAQGFIYLVSSMGVTGVRSNITTNIKSIVAEIKKNTDIPVAVGFGVSKPAQVAEFSKYADGVIVGSAIVRIIEEFGENAAKPLSEYVKNMVKALS